jgi:uncharacterized protein (UPF0332 family)
MTPEQGALIRKAKDSLKAARIMAEGELYDFAISRAYYTMFYVAQAFLLGEGKAYSKHSGVIAAFGKEFAKTGRVPKEFHSYLIEGFDRRNVGDYDIKSDVTNEETTEQIVRAEKFVELAEKLIGPEGPPQE